MKMLKVKTIYPEVGKKYYDYYWLKSYECIGIKKTIAFGTVYICKWEDGRITEHCTKLDDKDREIVED